MDHTHQTGEQALGEQYGPALVVVDGFGCGAEGLPGLLGLHQHSGLDHAQGIRNDDL